MPKRKAEEEELVENSWSEYILGAAFDSDDQSDEDYIDETKETDVGVEEEYYSKIFPRVQSKKKTKYTLWT